MDECSLGEREEGSQFSMCRITVVNVKCCLAFLFGPCTGLRYFGRDGRCRAEVALESRSMKVSGKGGDLRV